jgi:hypothetical protein
MVDVIRRGVVKGAALALLLFAAVTLVGADASRGTRFPDLGDCEELQVPAGNKVAFQAHGVGAQIYRWNGTSWVFVAPEAVLFEGRGVVAIHFADPTWQSNSGSEVVGAVIDHCTPDPDAIPWLFRVFQR